MISIDGSSFSRCSRSEFWNLNDCEQHDAMNKVVGDYLNKIIKSNIQYKFQEVKSLHCLKNSLHLSKFYAKPHLHKARAKPHIT